jgi:hypothetical protein
MRFFGMANLTGFHGHFMAAPRRVKDAFRKGPHVFNLRHGITPDADPDTGQLMIDTVRGGMARHIGLQQAFPFLGPH